MKRSIGYNIKTLRKNNSFSQDDVAKRLHVDRTMISKWENDHIVPSLFDLKKLSILFNVSLDELVFNEKKTKRYNIQLIIVIDLFLILLVILIIFALILHKM